MNLTLVRGLPGSGKSTFACKMFQGILHLENDMFHMVDGTYQFSEKDANRRQMLCMDIARMALKNGSDVVVSNVFVSKRVIDSWKIIAETYGAKFKVYRMMNDFGNVHNVPSMVYGSMRKGFQDYDGETRLKSVGDGYEEC